MKTQIVSTFLADIEGVPFANQTRFEFAKNVLEYLEGENVTITPSMVKDFKLAISIMFEHAEVLDFLAFEFDLQVMIQNHTLQVSPELTETNHQAEEFFGTFLESYGVK